MEGSDYMEEEIRHWIQQINDETILPSDIVAFNFGLFESEEGYCIYLTGSKFYDESDAAAHHRLRSGPQRHDRKTLHRPDAPHRRAGDGHGHRAGWTPGREGKAH